MSKHPTWRVAQFDTLRLRLVKLAVRVLNRMLELGRPEYVRIA